MPAIRCPHCGKPNPDFIDVCQYCDQPLREGGAAAPTSAPSAAGETIRKSLVIHCPNCGRPNPDVADHCQYCNAALRPAAVSGEAAAPEAEPEAGLPDWLKALRGEAVSNDAPFAPPTAEVNHDWEWTGAAAEPPAEPASAVAADDLPDWLKELQPDSGAAAAAPASDLPDWLQPGAGSRPAESSAPEPAATTDEVPDWLKGSTAASAESTPAGDLPDWLQPGAGSRPAESSAPEPAATTDEVPDWLKGSAAASAESTPAGELPDWLQPGAGSRPAESSAPEPAVTTDEVPDWLKGSAAAAAESTPAGELPDWLKRSTGTGPLAKTSAAATPDDEPPLVSADLPDWLKGATGALPAEPAPAPSTTNTDLPDWLKGATGALTPPPSAAPPAAAVVGDVEEIPAAADLPDWLRDFTPGEEPATTTPAVSPAAPLPAVLPQPGDAPDFLNNLRGAAEPVMEDEQPDWLKSLGISESAPAAATPALDLSAPAPAAEAEPDWMQTLRSGGPAPEAEPTPPESEPDWLSALRPGGPGESHGSAVSPFASAASAPSEAEPGASPDWLAALRPAEAAPLSAGLGAASATLAQGELPSWLAAMRPVAVERTTIEPEVDDYQEAVGILAGMRGVLRAEPGVVLPGKSAANVHTLAFTGAHTEQTELLAGMLLRDKAAAPAAPRSARVIPWERWLIAVVILLGLLVPPALLGGLFPLPTTAPAETRDAFQMIEALPADKPVLVVFDYEPAQSGEMGLTAEAVLGHLTRRGLPVVALSPNPGGAALAQSTLETTLDSLAQRNGYSATVSYLNLGYLPGGPLGVLQFAQDPRSMFQADFAGDDYAAQGGLWQLPVLKSVTDFSSFSAAVIFSATPDGARAWIEQTQGQATPLLLAVSAGAAPLVRPYYEADHTHVAGLVSGAIGAMQYEKLAGVFAEVASEPLQRRWEMLGGGLLTIALLLLLGNVVHGALQLLRRPKGKGKA